jgi:hypothetical protein
MKEAYPLCWPAGYQRTQYRRRSLFKQSMEKAQKFLREEIERLGAGELIVSTNIPVRNDGGLYVDYMRRKIDDPGVAIYFVRKKKEIALCCDEYETVWENIYALGKGIEKLRGLERDGISDFLDRAFTGFAALPPPMVITYWWNVLGVSRQADAESIKATYRELVKIHHPDKGGNADRFNEIQKAYEEGLQQLKSKL